MDFDDVIAQLRAASGRTLKWPSQAQWSAHDQGGEGIVLEVELPAAAMGANLQGDLPASPAFLLCAAWWLEHTTGRTVRSRVRLSGPPPASGNERLHWHRSQFLLDELARLLPARFDVVPSPGWTWPPSPVVNGARQVRSDTHHHDPQSEHALEVHITTSPALLADFNARVAPIAAIRRQLPVGLFRDGRVSKETAWTPGGASQVDLWGPSPDGRTLHLFELKKQGNSKVGIVTEALYYARLLHHVRLGRVGGDPPELAEVRRAERLVFWLIAPSYHPLVYLDGHSPLAWLNAAMVDDHVELRILPIGIDAEGTVTWRPELAWQ